MLRCASPHPSSRDRVCVIMGGLFPHLVRCRGSSGDGDEGGGVGASRLPTEGLEPEMYRAVGATAAARRRRQRPPPQCRRRQRPLPRCRRRRPWLVTPIGALTAKEREAGLPVLLGGARGPFQAPNHAQIAATDVRGAGAEA